MSREKYIFPDILERLALVQKHAKANQTEFANKLMVSQGYLSDVVNEKSQMTARMIIGLAINYPEIDIGWLLTGNGEMMKSYANSPNSVHEPSEEYRIGGLPDEIKEINVALMALPEDKRKSVLKILKGIVELEGK